MTTSDVHTVGDVMKATPAEKNLWLEAIKDEPSSLRSEKKLTYQGFLPTGWMSYKAPNGVHILPTHVVLRIKRNEKGRPVRSIARVVAGGHLQVQGKDYNAVHNPVVEFQNFLLTQALPVNC